MTAHASYSPSALKRLMGCPASWKHNSGRKSKSSPYAVEGSIAHWLAEEQLKNDTFFKFLGGSVNAESFGGEKGETFEIPGEMIDYVMQYVDYANGIFEEIANPGRFMAVEEKIQIIPGKMWGTADAVISDPGGCLHIIDLKYGAGVAVAAENNPQLAAYAYGALETYQNLKPTSIKIHIFQPRASDFDGSKVWEIDDVEAFEVEWGAKLNQVIFECEEDWYFETGDWCQFCPGKLECPEMKEKATKAMTKGVEEHTDLTVVETSELLKFQNSAKAVQMFLKAVEAELESRAHGGETVRGWKLVKAMGNRAWTLPEEEMVKKFRNKGFKQAEYYDMKLISPAKAQKLINKKWVDRFTEKPERGVKFVPESDKRPPLQLEPAFEDMGDDDSDNLDYLFD